MVTSIIRTHQHFSYNVKLSHFNFFIKHTVARTTQLFPERIP